MSIFSGCLLASDYDGTLTNSEGIVPDEVKQINNSEIYGLQQNLMQ